MGLSKHIIEHEILGINLDEMLPAPGGADTQIQFNASGAFGGSANFTWDGTLLKSTTVDSVENDASTAINAVHNLTGITVNSFEVDTDGTLNTGLRMYYKMDSSPNTENVPDEVTGAYDAVPTGTTVVAGKITNARNFNGSSDFLANSFLPTGYSAISFSLWVNVETAGVYPRFISYGTNAQQSLEFGCEASNGKVHLMNRYNNAGAIDSVSVVGVGWVHFVGVADGSTLKLYKNGSLVDTYTGAYNINATTGNMRFGVRSDTATCWFDGSLDEIGIWDKVLSQQEITDLYNGGSGNTYSDDPSAKNNFGTRFLFSAPGMDTSLMDIGAIDSIFTDVTDGAEKTALIFSTLTAGGSLTEKVRIDDLGRVGIGTTSPTKLLDVYGDTSIGGDMSIGGDVSIGDDNLLLYDSDTAVLSLIGQRVSLPNMPRMNYMHENDTDALISYFTYDHDHMGITFDAWHNGTTWMSSDTGSNFVIYKYQDHLTIGYKSGITKGTAFSGFNLTSGVKFSNNGKLGIGCSPTAKLDVRGDALFNEDGNDYDFRVEGYNDPNLFFCDAGNDRVGIGTNTPGTKFYVNGDISVGGSNNELRFYEGANYVGFEAPALAGNQIWVLPDSDGNADEVLKTNGSGVLSWGVPVGSLSFEIDASGGTGDTYGVLAGTINSTNTTFTVSAGGYVSGSLKVYLNGQLQTQGSSEDWQETTPASGTFDFLVAPDSGDEIIVSYQSAVSTSGNADTVDGIHASTTATASKLLALDANKDLVLGTGDIEATESRLKKLNVNQTSADDIVDIQDNGTVVQKIYDGGIVDFPLQSGGMAYLSSAPQTIPNSTMTVVDLQTTLWESNAGEINLTTNKITVTKAGVYSITGLIYFLNMADGTAVQPYISINGTNFYGWNFINAGAGHPRVNIGIVVKLDANDYIELACWHNYGSDRTIQNGAAATFISYAKIA